MKTMNFNQRNIQIGITLLVLAGLLTYSFFHVAEMFVRYSLYPVIGYFMAFSLELSVFGLSLAIGWRKTSGRSTFYFWLVLSLSLLINVTGNVSEGFFIKQGAELTSVNYLELDIVQIVIALIANLLIPFVTMAQSKILGDFVFQVIQVIQKQERRQEKVEQAQEKITNFGLLEQERRHGILENYQIAATKTIPPMTQKQFSEAYSVSLPTIQNDIKVLVADEHIEKNGRGYKLK